MQITYFIQVSKVVKIRNRYNQVLHLTKDTNGKVTRSQLDTTNESQEVKPQAYISILVVLKPTAITTCSKYSVDFF